MINFQKFHDLQIKNSSLKKLYKQFLKNKNLKLPELDSSLFSFENLYILENTHNASIKK